MMGVVVDYDDYVVDYDDYKDACEDDYEKDEVLWHRSMGSGMIKEHSERRLKDIPPEGQWQFLYLRCGRWPLTF
jgi:hypothetical protein